MDNTKPTGINKLLHFLKANYLPLLFSHTRELPIEWIEQKISYNYLTLIIKPSFKY
jgi:hypothetical protein